MRRFIRWPSWALRWWRAILEWTGLRPMELLEVYVELAARAREVDERAEGIDPEDAGWWCPAAGGVA